jgi:hypothetical protein
VSDPRPTARVVVDVPDHLTRKAAWVLQSLCDAAGCRLEVVLDPDLARDAALAYAPRPVTGVPTIPVSAAAAATIAGGADVPAGSFASYDSPAPLVGAFRVPEAGFALSFDLVASAFVILAAWDEHTRPQRDQHGRFPYELSFFATEAALDAADPPLDGYVRVLRRFLSQSLDLTPPRWRHRPGPAGEPPGVGSGATRSTLSDHAAPARDPDTTFAIALTHDVDHLHRWTARAVAGSLRRAALEARAGDYASARWELECLLRAVTDHLPAGSDPYWTFPDLIEREDFLGIDSTFFAIASHHERLDGVDARDYERRLPALLRLLRHSGREVGLHGNSRDRVDLAALAEDRSRLKEMTAGAVEGIRFHYLRCLYHETLPLLEAAGFVYDSSLAFGAHEGPRCGLSFPFRPYCLARDRPLELVELPLIVMDGTLQDRHYRNLPVDEGRAAAQRVLAAVRDVGGAAALLWHNTRLDPLVSRDYGQVYWDLIEWMRANHGVATSAGDVVAQWRSAVGL